MQGLRLLLVIIMLFPFYDIVISQELYTKDIIRDNEIKILNCYSMNLVDGIIQDSSLYTTQIFNKEGNAIYDQRISPQNTYSKKYNYEADTLLLEVIQSNREGIMEIEKYKNENGLPKKMIVINEAGDTLPRYVVYKYNKVDQLTDWKMFFGKALGYHYVYKYHDNGQIKMKKCKKGYVSCVTYDKSGQIKKSKSKAFKTLKQYSEKNPNGTTKKYYSSIKYKKNHNMSIGPKSTTYNSGDQIITIYDYDENGIIQYSSKFKNDQLIEKQHFHFITF